MPNTKLLLILLLLASCIGCSDSSESDTRKGTWVNGHITRNGRYIKGHFRNSVSFDRNKFKNNLRSRSYYQRNKYRYRKGKR